MRTRIAGVFLLAVSLSGCSGTAPSVSDQRAEEADLSPHRVDGGVLFSYETRPGTETVYLTGEFNDWSMTGTPMSDEDGDGVWTVVYPLDDGRYEYKFVVNGGEWVTDPNAHDTNPQNFNNGIAFIGIPRPLSSRPEQSEEPWKEDSELAPHPVEGGVLFSFEAPPGTRSVHLAGEFNRWSMNRDPMRDSDGDGIWRIAYPLEVGKRYEYKFVVDGGEWVTDPHAPEVNRQNYNNGVYHYVPPGVPYAVRILPSFGSRLKRIIPASAKLMCRDDEIDPASVEVTLSGSRLEHYYSPLTNVVTADLPVYLADGEYRLTFSARAVASGRHGETSVTFSTDRVPPVFESPDFFDDAVIYEIFVRSFYDSDGDGIGDLQGIIRKLDYLNDGDPATDHDLGIDALWMMPVCESPSYHGYDITDYYKIEPDYGTNEDFYELCREAHKRGMRIIFDYVVNHSAKAHPFLQDALGNPESEYSSWYQFTNPEQTKYEGFAGWDGMPLLNFDSREMRNYITEMAFFWMDPDGDGAFDDGVDGFRCDVAKGPPHDWWKELRKRTKSVRGDFLLFGEVWDGSPAVLDAYFDEEYDMQFDYPLYYKFLDLMKFVKIDDFDWMLEEERITYPKEAQLCRFLDNHDNDRTLTALNHHEPTNRLAVLILFTLPGTPMLYYGAEIGMTGDKPPDERVRTFMEWNRVEEQDGDPQSLLGWHRRLVRLRKQFPALSARHDSDSVTYRRVNVPDNPNVYAYLRSAGDETPLLVVCNLSSQTLERCSLDLASSDLEGGDHRLSEVFPGSQEFFKLRVQANGRFSLDLPRALGGHEGIVLALENL